MGGGLNFVLFSRGNSNSNLFMTLRNKVWEASEKGLTIVINISSKGYKTSTCKLINWFSLHPFYDYFAECEIGV